MPKFAYQKTLPQGDFPVWAERELEAIERSLESIPATLKSEDVTGTEYELVTGDQDKVKTTTNGSPVTITVPTHANAPFELGAMVYFYQEGAGEVTLEGDAGVTVRSRPGLLSGGQYALFFIWKEADNLWVASGDLSIAQTRSALALPGELVFAGLAPAVQINLYVRPGVGALSMVTMEPTT
jgi:hypothetical protein